MPVKNTFAVEIGEGFDKFKEFSKLFDKYRKSLEGTPGSYVEITGEMVKQEKALKGMTAGIIAQLELITKESEKVETIEASSKRMETNWRSISVHARNFWSSISSAAVSIRNNAIIGGLLGLGGLWGLDRLGDRAGAGRRQSTGLGVPYGEMNAFGLSFNRAVDAGGLLSAVSQARGNVGGAESSALFSLGINPMGGGNTSEMARQTLKKIRDLAKQTPEELLGPVLHEGYGTGSLGFSIEDLRRLRNMDDKEFGQYNRQFDLRSKQLGVDDSTLKKWQDFVNTLDTTGKRIETSLVRGLADAAGPLEKLSDAAATVVEKFVSSKGFDWVVGKITSGLEVFANYIGTEDFKKNVSTFAEAMSKLAGWAMDFMRWIADNKLFKMFEQDKKDIDKISNFGKKAWDWGKYQYDRLVIPRLPDGTAIEDSYPPGYSPGGGTPSNTAGTIAGVGDMNGLMDLIAKLEGGTDGQANSIGATGKYQVMPSTGALYGFTREQLMTPSGNRAAAEALVKDLHKRYNGDTAQILAAYNAGPQIGDYLRDHGNKSLPMYRPSDGAPWDYKQTQGYLNRAGFRVTIDNPAGANVTTQADMMGGSYPGVTP